MLISSWPVVVPLNCRCRFRSAAPIPVTADTAPAPADHEPAMSRTFAANDSMAAALLFT